MGIEKIEFQEKEFNPEEAISRLKPLLSDIGEDVLAIRESGNMAVETKKDFTDIVTRADKYAERMIVDHIKQFYPEHRIRGEEGTDIKSDSEYEWIIDPIDGTTNFASGMDFFGISIGLYKKGIGQLGIMYFPALKKFAHASKGNGAWVNNERVTIRQEEGKTLDNSLITAGLVSGTFDKYPLLRERSRNVLLGGSFTAEALWLIEEKVDACIHTGATPYDLAAARIIVEEAGGVSSGIKGDEINLSNKQIPVILAKSSGLVGELRELLGEKI